MAGEVSAPSSRQVSYFTIFCFFTLLQTRTTTKHHTRNIVTLGETFDADSVEFVVSWKHPEGSLQGLRNCRAIFSLGAGVDHLLGDKLLPDVPIAR